MSIYIVTIIGDSYSRSFVGIMLKWYLRVSPWRLRTIKEENGPEWQATHRRITAIGRTITDPIASLEYILSGWTGNWKTGERGEVRQRWLNSIQIPCLSEIHSIQIQSVEHCATVLVFFYPISGVRSGMRHRSRWRWILWLRLPRLQYQWLQ